MPKVVDRVVTEEIAGWAESRGFVHKWVELDQPRKMRLGWIENQSTPEAAMAALAVPLAVPLALVADVGYEQKTEQRSPPSRWVVLEPPAVIERVVVEAEAEVAAGC